VVGQQCEAHRAHLAGDGSRHQSDGSRTEIEVQAEERGLDRGQLRKCVIRRTQIAPLRVGLRV
jgi:hypothetical protein